MHFHKFPHPSNFEFPGKITANHNFKARWGTYRLTVQAAADDVYHLQITGKGEFTFTTEKIIRTVTLNGVRVRRVSTQGIAFGTRKLTTWSL